MADKVRGVWGIDIGLAGLKAVRLVYAEAAKQVLATAFDYVPHPKILSQPDANPEELIAQALDTFLSRNNLQGDGVAISVPGQTALARFIQLPPVESSKVVEIVKYEARQQIPFALEEVIWDFQPLGGGVEESGFLLDAEVGLFAMKRDQVNQHLAPFLKRKVEVDLIQIAPLALYNYLCHDLFGQAAGGDSSEQEQYTLVLDMGADNTTLLVSNGKKIWIRNVPLGGNHFTRALTKEMKLTFAKAEHLKCNATKAPDPKAVFQALRPVFNDYVAEIQRSIGYFSSVNRDAKIGKIVGVGNGFKLAGLQKFLQQNLQMDVERVDHFQALAGDTVLNAPLFQENILSFAVPYGLALQGLKITRVHTSLLPPEITTARLIRKKKPWAVVTAATILAGLAISTMGYAHVWSTVSTDRFGEAEKKAESVIGNKGSMKSAYDGAVSKNKSLKAELDNILTAGQGRTQWLEVYKAITECLPRDVGNQRDEQDPTKKNRIRILSITAEKMDDLSKWFGTLDENAKKQMREDDAKKGPSGGGYVFTLVGRHFHYDPQNVNMQYTPYVTNTLLRSLQQWKVPQVDLQTGAPTGVETPVRQLGITHPTIVLSDPVRNVLYYQNGAGPARGPGGGENTGLPTPGLPTPATGGVRPAKPGPKGKPAKKAAVPVEINEPGAEGAEGRPIPLSGFTLQFVWVPTPESKRQEKDPSLPAATAPGPAASGTPSQTPPAGIQGTPAPQNPTVPPATPVGAPGVPTTTPGAPANSTPSAPAGGGTTPPAGTAPAPVGTPAPKPPGT